MKINLLLFLFAITLIAFDSKAQEEKAQEEKGKKEAISDIKAPSSPAAVVLGNTPNTIDRPKSFEALEASLFTNYSNSEGSIVIPNDFAIEFSPYWAVNKINMDDSAFLNPSMGLSMLQNLSFSLSSTQNFILQDSINSKAIGLGFRTMLVDGHKDYQTRLMFGSLKGDMILLNKISEATENVDCQSGCTKDQYIEIITQSLQQKKVDGQKIKKLEQLLYQSLDFNPQDMDSNSDAINDLMKGDLGLSKKLDSIEFLRANRKGFKLEMAAALAFDFPSNETDSIVVPRWGVWFTPSYQPYRIEWIEFLGVIRYFWYDTDFYSLALPDLEVFKNTIDYGARLALKKNKYSLEFEAIGRYGATLISKNETTSGSIIRETKEKKDFQWLLNFNYQINEKLILSYNFGKKFDPIVVNYGGNLISMATLNFGINPPNKSDISK